MKQLLVLSGKGGTGKTTVSASFIQFLQAKAYADCDVDAPNLHLATKMTSEPVEKDYFGMDKAEINHDLCIGCGKCMKSCRFHAIYEDHGKYSVNLFACEGCSVCQAVCPVEAVKMKADIAGKQKLYKDEKVFSTATLKMGSGTSGKLVTEVKKSLLNEVALREQSKEFNGTEITIIDGSPGIGCPVIASVAGVDLILLVTEPTVSGISDMKRVIEVADHFKIPVAICTNKYDVNKEKTKEIESFAKSQDIPFVGVIPFDKGVAEAINQGKDVVESNCLASSYLYKIYQNTMELI